MIHATEAYKLYCKNKIGAVLDVISKEIIKAANSGQTKVLLSKEEHYPEHSTDDITTHLINSWYSISYPGGRSILVSFKPLP